MKSQDSMEDDTFDDLVGHALGLIDDPPMLGIMGALPASHRNMPEPERLERVRGNLAVLLDDGFGPRGENGPNPPLDLRKRVLERVQEHEAITLEFREPMVYRPRWRVADFAVAAAVLFAAFLGSFKPLRDGKAAAANLACSSNLSQIWKGVEQYAMTYNVYPNASVHDQRLPVGATLALLLHMGHLDESVPLTCPGCTSPVHARQLPQWNQLRQQSEQVLAEFSAMMADVYALHPGVRDQVGLRHLERSTIDAVKSVIPLAGDRPPPGIGRVPAGANSPAHGGFGQNLIFADGHSGFYRSRSMRSVDQDIYSNRLGRSGAAVDAFDIILMPAWACPNSD